MNQKLPGTYDLSLFLTLLASPHMSLVEDEMKKGRLIQRGRGRGAIFRMVCRFVPIQEFGLVPAVGSAPQPSLSRSVL